MDESFKKEVDSSELRRFLVKESGSRNENNDVLPEIVDVPVKVVEVSGMGRAVVSLHPQTEIGRVLFRERPVLVWNTTDDYDDGDKIITWKSYLDAFLEAPVESKAVVLDMHAPSMNSDQVRKYETHARMVYSSGPKYASLGQDQILKLMAIANTNSHEYYGRPGDDFHNVVSSNAPLISRPSSGKAALFAFGSKVAHGCRPNVSYSSKTEDGCLEYKLIAPVDAGDVLTFGYIDVSPANPTHIRRRQLLETKSFFCECDLCKGPDYARAFNCNNKTKKCSGQVVVTQSNTEATPTWSCTVCGPIHDSDEIAVLRDAENKVERLLQATKARLMMPSGVANVPPSDAESLVSIASDTLSRTHYLTLQCQFESARICASHAHGINQVVQFGFGLTPTSRTPVGSLYSVRTKAASFGIDYIRGCECIAAKCLNSNHGSQCDHPLVYECSINAFHAFQDLKDNPTNLWPKDSAATLRKYIEPCYVQFGKNDSDVKEMEAILDRRLAAVEKDDTPATTTSSTLITGQKNKTIGKNKKKRNQTNKKKKKSGRK